MKIMVDGREFPSKKKALEFFEEAMWACEGCEGERMKFAYLSIKDGCNVICTYSGYAVKPIKK